jgi:hypothetical protein
MQRCPNCQETTRQNKAEKTDAGSQRYRCMHCQRRYAPKKQSKLSLTKRRKQNSTTVMGLMPTHGFGITLADMKFRKARRILIPSKPIMPNSVTTLPASLANLVVFLGVRMHLNVHCAYLFMPSTAGNFISNAFRITPHSLWTLLAHDV